MSHVFCQCVTIDQLEAIKIKHPLFNATLLLQGAQLIEFTPRKSGKNLLWLSDHVEYTQGKPLRGGIPICWPWFGDLSKNPAKIQQQANGSTSAHGFARSLPWEIETIKESCHQVEVILTLTNSVESKKIWPFDFNLQARFILSETLSVELTTTNTGIETFAISQALHTYLPTEDIHKTYIHNAHNSAYIDALDNWKEKKQNGRIGFSEETDRLYFFKPENGSEKDASGKDSSYYELRVESPNQQLLLKNSHSQSAVIWNPWIEKSQRLSQFRLQDYLTMFCIETANVLSDHKVLAPAQRSSLKFELSQI